MDEGEADLVEAGVDVTGAGVGLVVDLCLRRYHPAKTKMTMITTVTTVFFDIGLYIHTIIFGKSLAPKLPIKREAISES